MRHFVSRIAWPLVAVSSLSFGCTPGVTPTSSSTTGATSSGASTTGAGGSSSSSGSTSSGTGGAAPAKDPFYSAGSRLKPEYFDYGGGATQFTSWFDTTLNTECQFARFATGDYACIPAAGSTGQYFADANCSTPLMSYYPSTCSKLPVYASVQSTAQSCATPNWLQGTPGPAGIDSVYAVGPQFTGETYVGIPGNCIKQAPPTSTTVYQLGSPAPLSKYVTGTLTMAPRGENLSIGVINASDGSSQLMDRTARHGTTPCRISPLLTGARVCKPIYRAWTLDDSYFLKNTCATPDAYNGLVALHRTDLCGKPEYVEDYVSGPMNCGSTQSFLTPGADTTLPPLFTGTPTMCTAFTVPSNVTALKVGSQLDPVATFGALKNVTFGSGRIVGNYDGTGPMQPLAPPGSFTDTTTMQTCTVISFDDGTLRCVDSDVATYPLYADAQCQTQIFVYQKPNCGQPGTTPTRALIPSTTQTCSAAPAAKGVSMLVPTTAITSYYNCCGAGCSPMTFDPTTQQAFTLGSSVDLSQYATVKIVKP